MRKIKNLNCYNEFPAVAGQVALIINPPHAGLSNLAFYQIASAG
jgi:hypothetical protein